MRRFAWATFATAVLNASCGDSNSPRVLTCGGKQAEPECHTISVAGRTRDYLLHVPSSFHPGSGSLVIALHGVGQLAPDMRDGTGLNAKADAAGFAIAYPNALVVPSTGIAEWNVMFTKSLGADPPDDIGFLRQLVVTLQQQLGFDAKRVYVTGMSNGGLMTHRVGVELGDLVAAVGIVSGTLAERTTSASQIPNAAQPVSVIMLHGDLDGVVQCCPFKAGPTQDDAFNYWSGARANACATVSTTALICAGPETPSTLAEKHATGCRGGVEVRFYQLQGGVHHWYTEPMNVAGQVPYNPFFDSSTGATTNDILWNFFAAHPKP
jgi:polyhydroxybutyrate depolymerase